jgi:uncharacterized protein YeaO (DUF488 family)
MANLGPSEKLLSGILSGKLSWPEFSHRYRDEIFASASLDKSNRTIKNHGQKFTLRLLQELGRRGNVTLMCHCAEGEQHCHRHLLAKILKGKVG